MGAENVCLWISQVEKMGPLHIFHYSKSHLQIGKKLITFAKHSWQRLFWETFLWGWRNYVNVSYTTNFSYEAMWVDLNNLSISFTLPKKHWNKVKNILKNFPTMLKEFRKSNIYLITIFFSLPWWNDINLSISCTSVLFFWTYSHRSTKILQGLWRLKN